MPDADVIDDTGCVVILGLECAHSHVQTAPRGIAAIWTLPQYFSSVYAGLAKLFSPDDHHIGWLVGALISSIRARRDWETGAITIRHLRTPTARLTASSNRASVACFSRLTY
ncbi:hypothetical protein [Paraburkholderia heleia]|uniref:hypothetical protein n=1 Tax=Paraburkholderia heleia TaxID=634127 RepID=UPI0031E10C5F